MNTKDAEASQESKANKMTQEEFCLNLLKVSALAGDLGTELDKYPYKRLTPIRMARTFETMAYAVTGMCTSYYEKVEEIARAIEAMETP